MTGEAKRLEEARTRTAHWRRWGPYLSERAWGTVREDYSEDGAAWDYFPHDHARSRAYRWSEDGIAGICDRHQLLCFAIALWNGHDPILKERLFGLSGSEGNHGEDVKERYYYLDNTPTHSYMRMLYKYPQTRFPYDELVEKNRALDRRSPEYEILDTQAFADGRCFDVFVEYAKADVDDILIQISVANRGPDPAPLHLLPTLWFRNTWSWGRDGVRPALRRADAHPSCSVVEVDEPYYGPRRLLCGHLPGGGEPPALLFTENETNARRLYGAENSTPYVKDAINDCVVHGVREAVNPEMIGTKAAAHYRLVVPPGESVSVRLRLTDAPGRRVAAHAFGARFDKVFEDRRREADDFYAEVIPAGLSADAQNVMRQALAGLLWSKQFYHYVAEDWLRGDAAQRLLTRHHAAQPPAPPQRLTGRNHAWLHLYNADVIAMPDKWEYPWYAAWDLAFHCIPTALVDPEFAKEQLVLLLREWYMHPNGQLPAYEWALDDVNPPVHAWAALRVYKMEEERRGVGDHRFLERVFHKLMLNFTWWVNRKDPDGLNVFEGGFLGLDNIGVFDRSAPLPTGGHIEQSDGTSWMGMYTLNMLAASLELARRNTVYEDAASKFLEHFVYIAHAINTLGLWDEDDGFYYDVLHMPDGSKLPLKVRSMVGLIPLLAVETLESEALRRLPGFTRRLEWFVDHRQDLLGGCGCMRTPGHQGRRLLTIVHPDRLRRVLAVMLDEEEFLSPYGIRSLSRRHLERPYTMAVNSAERRVAYEPAESSTGTFGGNSNWRGPVWFPMNYLIIESLQKYHHYLGDDFKVECPTGSGRMATLAEVASDLSRRLIELFLRGPEGRRPMEGDRVERQDDPHSRDLVLFHEYFNGDTGEGLGASHQTGWTALVANLIQQSGQ